MNNKQTTVGISGRTFLAIQFVIMFLLFACGLFFFAPSGNAIAELVQFLTGGFLKGLVFRGGVMTVYVLLQSYIVFEHVLDTPLWKRDKRVALGEQIEAPRNNSHAFVLTGIILSGLALATIINASTPNLYLFAILTRGVVGEFLGNMVTMAIAYCFGGVRSMDDFRKWVNEQKDNDSHSIIIAFVKLASLVLCLVVG